MGRAGSPLFRTCLDDGKRAGWDAAQAVHASWPFLIRSTLGAAHGVRLLGGCSAAWAALFNPQMGRAPPGPWVGSLGLSSPHVVANEAARAPQQSRNESNEATFDQSMLGASTID